MVARGGSRVLTVKSALVPVELGWAGDRRGAERSTSGVNLVAVRVMLTCIHRVDRLQNWSKQKDGQSALCHHIECIYVRR